MLSGVLLACPPDVVLDEYFKFFLSLEESQILWLLLQVLSIGLDESRGTGRERLCRTRSRLKRCLVRRD